MAAQLEVRLLGPFGARLNSGRAVALPTKKAQALLAYLALRPGRACARETLMALLWGEAGERQARQSFRQALSSLRRVVGKSGLLVDGESVALRPSAISVDVRLFERLVAKAEPAALARVVSLYGGDLLEGLSLGEESFEAWLRAERQRLRELAVGALTRLLGHQSKRGTSDEAIQTAVRLLALDPLQESVHRELMRLYVRQGRPGAALRQHQTCVATLQRELGAAPEPDTKRLYREILQRPSAEPAPPRSGAGAAPKASREPGLGETPLIGRDRDMQRGQLIFSRRADQQRAPRGDAMSEKCE
jgi:DNA-binding SARP family transcriptional activator